MEFAFEFRGLARGVGDGRGIGAEIEEVGFGAGRGGPREGGGGVDVFIVVGGGGFERFEMRIGRIDFKPVENATAGGVEGAEADFDILTGDGVEGEIGVMRGLHHWRRCGRGRIWG